MRSRFVGARFLQVAGLAVLLAVPGLPASADGSGSRILQSPSRSTVYRGQPETRSLRPGDDTVSRSLSGRIGDLEAEGGMRSLGGSRTGRSQIYDCVLHHERLERSARQPFATQCDPSIDRGAGYPAFTTR